VNVAAGAGADAAGAGVDVTAVTDAKPLRQP
jgi:hypothetical protein